MVNDKVCFVISPIDKEGGDIRRFSDLTFEYIIKPIVQDFGYNPIRADHIKESGMITYQIIDHIIDSPLVIADLTYANPNVFYELAIRHIVEKPYIQMIKSDQKIPFDVSGMRTIRFDIDVEQADSAKKELLEQIKSIENNNFKAINPVTLAINYSKAKKMIKEGETLESGDIAKIVFESIMELKSMVRDVWKINSPYNIQKISYSLAAEELNRIQEKTRQFDSKQDQTEYLLKMRDGYSNIYEEGKDKMSSSLLNTYHSIIEGLQYQLYYISQDQVLKKE